MEVSTSPGPFRLGITGAWHFESRYRGEGEWNLREDLMQPRSFSHEAKGYGATLTGKWFLNLGSGMEIGIRTQVYHRSTRSGTDTAYLTSGEEVTMHLREVDWVTTAAQIGFSKSFQ